MEEVIHITPHMGGGVGKVLSRLCSYKSKKYTHDILLLEPPQKSNFVDFAVDAGVSVRIFDGDFSSLSDTIKSYDIIQIEWWQHPKTMKLLSEFPQEQCRLVTWAHVNGCHYPFLSFELAKYANVIFTCEYSLNNPNWTDDQRSYFQSKQNSVVHSSGGLDDFASFAKMQKNTDYFNIGYIGTLSFSKLNRNFIDYCRAVNIENAVFTLVGDTKNEKYLLREAKKNNLNFNFTGYVNDPRQVISNFDVLGYPLDENHFGTTENALIEAMAMGIVPICLKQNTEGYIIKHGETGFLAENEKEYGEYVRFLYNDNEKRKEMAKKAAEYAVSAFSLDKTVEGLEAAYDKTKEKTYYFIDVIGNSPVDWFLSGLCEEHKDAFRRVFDVMEKFPVLKGDSKGSLMHFYREFVKKGCFNEIIAKD